MVLIASRLQGHSPVIRQLEVTFCKYLWQPSSAATVVRELHEFATMSEE